MPYSTIAINKSIMTAVGLGYKDNYVKAIHSITYMLFTSHQTVIYVYSEVKLFLDSIPSLGPIYKIFTSWFERYS